MKERGNTHCNNIRELIKLNSVDEIESQRVKYYLKENHFSTIVDLEDSATDLTEVSLFCHKYDYIEIDSRFANKWYA